MKLWSNLEKLLACKKQCLEQARDQPELGTVHIEPGTETLVLQWFKIKNLNEVKSSVSRSSRKVSVRGFRGSFFFSPSRLSHSLLLACLSFSFLEAVVVCAQHCVVVVVVDRSGLFHVYIVWKSKARLEYYSMFCFRGALSQARTTFQYFLLTL